ncbi:hypothetical protein [Vitreoscilla filiformis]|uniref:hypothetical protein n=1 Tax=Vitreoscilla filiformis TaxID=63 RepID=UPI0012FE30BE|nr:hypothetical protein [Vitreoscilla filiformis]
MSTKTKNIEVIIPESIQNKIDGGDYKILGTQVRDRKGRIVCNLDSLDSGDGKFFSPHIFQSFEGCTFLSCSIVSSELQEELRKVQSSISGLDLKIDKVLSRQTNDLIGFVVEFDEHLNSLMEGSKLTSEKETFQSGVRAASLLASHIESYLNDFKGSTIIFHRDSAYEGEAYSQYIQRGKYKPRVIGRKTSRFCDHQANFFAWSFLKVINNINILSISYDKKIFARYEENLDALEDKLKSVLNFLMREIGEEGDIYHMCYSTRGYNGIYYPMDIERVIRRDENIKINDLILRDFPKNINLEYDEGRVKSINDIIDLLEEIESLKLRSAQVSDLNISDLSEIEDVKREIFKLE